MKIVTIVDWFDKQTEELTGSEEITNISINQLQDILAIPEDPDDPELIAGGYALDKTRLDRLIPFMEHQYDLSKYDYFLGRFG